MTQETQETKINDLEKDILGINYRLDSQGKVLEEIRDVLVQQSQILQNVSAIRETVNQVREDVDHLEIVFEKRKETTDNNNKTFLEFVNKAKGALAVCLVIFGLVQALVIDEFKDNSATHKELQLEVKQLHKEIITLQASKTHQNAPQQHPLP